MLVELYTIKGCHNCKLIKEYLDKNNIKYTVVDGDKEFDKAIKAMDDAHANTLPILKYDNNFIVGYNQDNLDKFKKLYNN